MLLFLLINMETNSEANKEQRKIFLKIFDLNLFQPLEKADRLSKNMCKTEKSEQEFEAEVA